jgi:hypothetical protein
VTGSHTSIWRILRATIAEVVTEDVGIEIVWAARLIDAAAIMLYIDTCTARFA